jgi:hypothetical protein
MVTKEVPTELFTMNLYTGLGVTWREFYEHGNQTERRAILWEIARGGRSMFTRVGKARLIRALRSL